MQVAQQRGPGLPLDQGSRGKFSGKSCRNKESAQFFRGLFRQFVRKEMTTVERSAIDITCPSPPQGKRAVYPATKHSRCCAASLSVLPTTHSTTAPMAEISPLSPRNFCSASRTE